MDVICLQRCGLVRQPWALVQAQPLIVLSLSALCDGVYEHHPVSVGRSVLGHGRSKADPLPVFLKMLNSCLQELQADVNAVEKKQGLSEVV